MPAAELTRWQAWERVNGPLGRKRDDILTGRLQYQIAGAFSDKRAAARLKVEDFIPKWGTKEGPKETQTPEHQKAVLQRITAMFKRAKSEKTKKR